MTLMLIYAHTYASVLVRLVPIGQLCGGGRFRSNLDLVRGRGRLVCLLVEVSEEYEENDSVAQHPVDKQLGVVTVHHQQLARVHHYQHKLRL